jgi:hypothetical protein
MGVPLMGVPLMGVPLIGVNLIGVPLMGVPLMCGGPLGHLRHGQCGLPMSLRGWHRDCHWDHQKC